MKKASCCVSLVSKEVSGAEAFFFNLPLLCWISVWLCQQAVRPCADSLLAAGIHIPTSGLPKHISVVQVPADYRHASTIEAARSPFSHELYLPTSDRHNIKKRFFFPSVKTLDKVFRDAHGWFGNKVEIT